MYTTYLHMYVNIEYFPLKESIYLFDIKYVKKKKKVASLRRTARGRLLWKCEKGEGLDSGRCDKDPGNLERVCQKDLGGQQDYGY